MPESNHQENAWTSSFDNGTFVRKQSEFRSTISHSGPYYPESGRYHLYVSLACPWAHRTLLVREWLGLHDVITVSVVDWRMNSDGSWSFNPEEPGCTIDHLYGASSLEEIYQRADPSWKQSGCVGTVPVLWDSKLETIVNNESREIIRMLSEFVDDSKPSAKLLSPPPLREAIDAMIDSNYESINNGVYKTGFAKTQQAYEEAVTTLFGRLDEIESHLEDRDWLVGGGRGQFTEADVCLFPTLVRFDDVYVGHFKCNLQRIKDYPNLSAYVQRILMLPGVADTCNSHHIKWHYYWSHQHLNPYRIVPIGPR